MTSLVALLSTGKGTWSHVVQIIEKEEWSQIILVTNEFGKQRFAERFGTKENSQIIVVDLRKPAGELVKDIYEKICGKVKGLEVAVNISSGTGQEHMALISALIHAGLGIRFVDIVDEKVQEVCVSGIPGLSLDY